MGFPLVLIGLLMIVTGGRGTYAQFGQQIASEFQGKNNFAFWLLAIIAVGAIGYVSALQTLSRYLLALVILSIFLSHKGFFAQFSKALQTGPTPPNAVGSGTVAQAGTTNGLFGQAPSSPGQAKANGWFNYFLGSPIGATQ